MIKFLKGDLNEKDADYIIDVIRNNKDERKRLIDTKNIWDEAGTPGLEETIDIEKAILLFTSLTESKQPENKIKNKRVISLYKYSIRIAAVLVLGFLIWFLYPKQEISYIELQSQNEIKNAIILPDSSSIDLNKNSRISYSSVFASKNREVILEGEAYFNVKKEHKKPFIIYTGNAKIEVLGTKFYVISYTDSNQVKVIVDEGQVSLSPNNEQLKSETSGKTQIIKKGEIGVFIKDKGEIQKSNNYNRNELLWKTRQFDFNAAPFDLLRITLEKEYNIRILLTNEEMKNCKITGRFNADNLESLLEVLELSIGIVIVKQGEDYIFDGEGCPD